MKDCMYSYHYHRNRAIMRKNQTGNCVLCSLLALVTLYGIYCLSTLVRS
jgi:hypothetical protein